MYAGCPGNIKIATMTDSILYCFISHRSVLDQDKIDITNMCIAHGISNFVIVCGGHNQDCLTDTVLYLNCDDTYEGLPDKIHTMFKYLTKNLSNYKTYVKLDRTAKIIQPMNSDISADYFGSVNTGEGDRTHHFNKCSDGSAWNKKSYEGTYVSWCAGPVYVLSDVAANIIANNPPDLSQEIYEDLYVAKCLLDQGNISPSNFNEIGKYFAHYHT